MREIITKLTNETIEGMAAQPVIRDRVSGKSMKNFLGALALGAFAIGLSGVAPDAQSKDFGKAFAAGTGVGTLLGIFNSKDGIPDYRTAGAAAAGAAVGSQIGNGNGQVAASVLLGGYAAVKAQNAIDKKAALDEEEKLRLQAERQTRDYRQGTQGNYTPTLFGGNQEQTTYSTTFSAHVVNALKGNGGGKDVSSDPVVKSALDKSFETFAQKYNKLYETTQSYSEIQQRYSGSATNQRVARYATDDNELISTAQQTAKERAVRDQALSGANRDLQKAYLEYGSARFYFFKNAENAVLDGFNVAPYGDALNIISAPNTQGVSYGGVINTNQPRVANRNRP